MGRRKGGRIIKIIFWNTESKDLTTYIDELINQENPDILILAEGENNTIPQNYKELNKTEFTVRGKKKELRYFYKEDSLESYDLEEENRYMIKEIVKGKRELLIIPLHLPSKLSSGQISSINSIFLRLSQTIEKLKERKRIEDVIFIGDFNLNPQEFDEIYSLETTNCCLAKATKLNQGVRYERYYNPSQHLLGNFDQPTIGSYHHENKWHLLDQVIMSKSLQNNFDKSKFKIVNLITSDLICKKGKPSISDHMPICVEFNI